jgi:hypothetical protein
LQFTGLIQEILPRGEAGLIQAKLVLDAELDFLRRAYPFTIEWAALESARNGYGKLYWKKIGEMPRPPTQEEVISILTEKSREAFITYLKESELIWKIDKFEVVSFNDDSFVMESETELRIARPIPPYQQVELHSIQNFSYQANLRYFLLYENAKMFADNVDGLLNYNLWEVIDGYDDHIEGSNTGCGGCTQEDESENVCEPDTDVCIDIPCPTLTVPSKSAVDAKLDELISGLKEELNQKFSELKVSWTIESLDTSFEVIEYEHISPVIEIGYCECGYNCTLPLYRDGECIGCGDWGYYDTECEFCKEWHVGNAYLYNYTLEITLTDEKIKNEILTMDGFQKLKLTFRVGAQILDYACAYHNCTTGQAPAPSNPYTFKSVDAVF